MRKYKEVKRKEIIYDLEEWKQVEKLAAKVSMQTSEYIRQLIVIIFIPAESWRGKFRG